MAQSLGTKKITELTEKTSPEEGDLYAVGDGGSDTLKKVTFANILSAIQTKLVSWTFTALNTTAKTLTGAINELKSTVATTSAAGMMSASDKSKLDAITASADAVSFTQSLTSGTQVGAITINGTATKLYAPTNTDTHYTTGLKVGASSSATANAAASNGSVYLNALDNSTVRDSHNIVGSGATTVASDANGKITISSTNTTYSAATTSANGLMSSTDKKNMTYFVAGTQTAATNAWTGTLSGITPYDGLTIRYYLPYAGTSTGATLALNSGTAYPVYRYGRTTQITTHFPAGSVITMTFRSSYSVAGTSYTNAWIVDAYYDSNSNTDTKVTNTLATTTKAYITGTTSATTNTGTQVFDTGVYLDTTAGQLVATTFKGALSGNATTATTATNATKLGGYALSQAGTKDVWGTVPSIGGSDGVMEVGKYIDFHTTDGNTADYDARITASTSGLTLSGTTTGTFSGSLTGLASKATADASGNTISSTYVKISSIVNNLTSTSPTSPLSAAQGKALQEEIDTLNTNAMVSCEHTLLTGVSLDDYTHGIYGLGSGNTNAPLDWCVLIAAQGLKSGYCMQLVTQVTTGKTYVRAKGGGNWTDWSALN